ncbi:hypothetical protein [Pseudolabrys sp.]|uniref:hypothetical protein n=1 Tax=Pseudolabrys sp. TaxID=1960880 RepID=UPI003D0C8B52
MSPTKKDRKIQSESGNNIPGANLAGPLGSNGFAKVVSEALRREFENTHSSVKVVVRLTSANERAVKNWFLAKNAPRGVFLIELMRHSDEILKACLTLAGRDELLNAKQIIDTRRRLEEALEELNRLQKE